MHTPFSVRLNLWKILSKLLKACRILQKMLFISNNSWSMKKVDGELYFLQFYYLVPGPGLAAFYSMLVVLCCIFLSSVFLGQRKSHPFINGYLHTFHKISLIWQKYQMLLERLPQEWNQWWPMQEEVKIQQRLRLP